MSHPFGWLILLQLIKMKWKLDYVFNMVDWILK